MGRQRQNDRHLPRGLYVYHGRRFDTYFTFISGQRVNLGRDRQQAEEQLQCMLNGTEPDDTIASMCRRFIKAQRALLRAGDKAALAASTIDEYEQSLEKFILPVFGHMPARSFKPSHAAQYLEIQREEGRPVRANRDIAALGSAFNYGMRLGKVDANPCHGVKRNTERPRTRLPSIDEVNRLIAIAKEKGHSSYMVALIGVMVAVTGRRRVEILRLSLDSLEDPAGIQVAESKIKPGETPRTFLVEWTPLLRELVAEARAVPRLASSSFLFSTRNGQPYTDSGFKAIWARIMTDFVAAGGERFTAHDLRALYVSEKIRRGENPETHKNEATTRRVYDRRKLVKVKPL